MRFSSDRNKILHMRYYMQKARARNRWWYPLPVALTGRIFRFSPVALFKEHFNLTYIHIYARYVWIFRECDSRTGGWWMHEFLGLSTSARGKAHRNFAYGKCTFNRILSWNPPTHIQWECSIGAFAKKNLVNADSRVGKWADLPVEFKFWF